MKELFNYLDELHPGIILIGTTVLYLVTRYFGKRYLKKMEL